MNADTALGGQGHDFPSTLWSQIAEAGDVEEGVRLKAWERLAARYWKPVYIYIRSKWAKSNEDAKDLTQDFFAWMLETGFPSRAEPSRGHFRHFLKTGLVNYLRGDHRSRMRHKRGGGRPVVVIDPGADGRGLPELPDRSAPSGDDLLEQSWKEELLRAAIKLLEEGYRKQKKESHFQVFHAYYLSGTAGLRHEDLAKKHDLSRSDVNNILMDGKRRFRDALTALVAETVRGPDELQDEMRTLFGNLFK